MRPFSPPSLAAILLVPPLLGLLAVHWGQDINWDLRNYHYYNPYAFLTGRWGHDIVPAQLPSFYNPLLYVPYYWLVEALPPRLVGFVLGALQGLNFVLLLMLARRVLIVSSSMAIAVAGVGVLGAGYLSQLGTSFFDNVLSLFFLTALLILVRFYGRLFPALAAGLVIGLAVGLKQTMVIYAIGLCVACLFAGERWRDGFWLAFVFGLGAIGGIAIGGGWWMWFLWERYGNPLFPHFNSVFQAPMAPLTDRRDPAYLPDSFWEALIYPFLFTFEPRRVGEIVFYDLRILVGFCLLPLAFLFASYTRPLLSRRRASRLVLVTVAATYAVWLPLFSIYRYLVGIELLAPLAILLAIDRLPLGRAGRLAAIAACFLLFLVTTHPGSWGRAPWPGTGDYFNVPAPDLVEPDRTMVIMAGWQPASYVIPKFPPGVRFVRIQSNFTSPNDVENRHNDLMQRVVAAHDGPLFVLFTDHEYADVIAALDFYGLRIVWPPCIEMPSSLDQRLLFCPLQRQEATAPRQKTGSQATRP